MRVALFSETYTPQRNGVAVVLARLVRYLTERGHEVLVATADPGGNEPPVPEGARVVRVPGPQLVRYPDITVALPFSLRVLRTVRAFRPDVVHLAGEYSLGLTGLWFAKRHAIPRLASFHTNLPDYLPYYGFGWASDFWWAYLRWFHAQAGVTFCPSETNRRFLEARGFSNVRVWGRGVDLDAFAPSWRDESVRRAHGPADAVHLLYVGRLTPDKDLPVLFRAYQKIAAARPHSPVQLLLAGDGAYAKRMEAEAPAGVTFLGYLEGAALSAVYSSADVFVFPSRVETLGNVVLEAMASGLPVGAADRGGALENVKHGVNGLLFPAGDSDECARAIHQLVNEPGLRSRLAGNARVWAEDRTWDRAFATLLDSYESLRDTAGAAGDLTTRS